MVNSEEADDITSSESRVEKPAQIPLSLRSNFSWTFLGNTVYAACQWAVMIVLARLGTPEMVGQFVLGIALTSPISIFFNLKLAAVQATDARRDYSFGDYLALRLLTSAIVVAIVLLIVLFSRYDTTTSIVVILIAAVKTLDSISDIIYGFLQQQERMERIAMSRILQGFFQVCSLAAVMVLTKNLVWGVTALVLSSAAITFFYDIPNAIALCASVDKSSSNEKDSRMHLPVWNWNVLYRLAMLSLPLGFATTSGSLGVNIPRYFVQGFAGGHILGIFAAVSSLSYIGTPVLTALGQSASPRLSQYALHSEWKKFDQLLLKLVSGGVFLGLSSFFITVLFGKAILRAVYGPEYSMSAEVMVWLMAGVGIQSAYLFFGSAINAMRIFKIQVPLQAISIIINTLLCYYLIPRYSQYGAAWAVMGSNVFELVAYVGVFLYFRKRTETIQKSIC